MRKIVFELTSEHTALGMVEARYGGIEPCFSLTKSGGNPSDDFSNKGEVQ